MRKAVVKCHYNHKPCIEDKCRMWGALDDGPMMCGDLLDFQVNVAQLNILKNCQQLLVTLNNRFETSEARRQSVENAQIGQIEELLNLQAVRPGVRRPGQDGVTLSGKVLREQAPSPHTSEPQSPASSIPQAVEDP